MGRVYFLVAVIAVIVMLSILPNVGWVTASSVSDEYVQKWFIAVKIDGGYVNTSLAEQLIDSVNLSMFTYVFQSGGREYLIYRSVYSPYLVIEAYNDNGAAIVSLHYVPKAEALLWWASPCGSAMQCDFAITNVTAIKNAASAAGWSVLELENRTYEKCTTITPGGSPPSCTEITEVRVILGKNITDGFVEAKIFSSLSQGSLPWSAISFLTNNPSPEASHAVKELMKQLLGMDYEPKWSSPTHTSPNLATAKNVLGLEATYLAKIGVLSTGVLGSEDVYGAVYALDSLNQTVELTQSGETYVTSDLITPNPLTIAEEIGTWPCTPYLGVMHPYCSMTTIAPPQTTTTTIDTTPPTTTQPTTISYPTNTEITGIGTQTATTIGGGTTTAEQPESSKDLTYLGIALILALIAAAITGTLVRRY